MTDIVSPQVRSRMMGRIRSRDTQPEMAVRRYLHAAGLRFRLQAKLPGRPDLALPRHKAVIFVHGCFWHQHPGCSYAYTPATRPDFWQAKFSANRARDRRTEQQLAELGWTVFVIWECQTRDELALDELAWAVLSATPRG